MDAEAAREAEEARQRAEALAHAGDDTEIEAQYKSLGNGEKAAHMAWVHKQIVARAPPEYADRGCEIAATAMRGMTVAQLTTFLTFVQLMLEERCQPRVQETKTRKV